MFADIKTKNLQKAISMLRRDSIIVSEVYTKSRIYKLGATDLDLVLCFDEQTDDNGNKINDILAPYSLRVEEIGNDRFQDIYEVDFVLAKPTGNKEYTEIVFGNPELLLAYLKGNHISNPVSIELHDY